MAKRKERAATKRSTRKKRAQVKHRTELQNGARRPSGVPLPSVGQVPNVGRVRSGYRLLRPQVLPNAIRPGNGPQRIPQSRNMKRCRKRHTADRHHRKIRSLLTKNSNPHSGMLPRRLGC